MGNARFKSSINRTPRKTTVGQLGDERQLRLELKVLADVGLLGMPNAGKSTLLSRVSRARPKIADYPFTTTYPHLGMVEIGKPNAHASGFVMADIPGLIEGAAQGVGLGIRFLKHLMRNNILLHVLDITPLDCQALAQSIRTIEQELAAGDASLLQKERWLVLNKIDVASEQEVIRIRDALLRELGDARPVYLISAATGKGCEVLVNDLMQRLAQSQQTQSANGIAQEVENG